MRNGGTIGRYNAPGMPDIYGSLIACYEQEHSGFSGAFWSDDEHIAGSTGGADDRIVYFNASKCNGEYGAQATVMPASVDMAVGIYLGCSAEV